MKNLLYIGNKLAKHGSTPTTIEILGPLLEREGFAVTYSSSAKNQFFRLLNMVGAIFKNRKADYVLIDTYSTANFWYAFVISQLCRMLNLKYIPILHGGNLPFRLKNNASTSRMIFNNSYQNVSPSHYLLEQFINQGYNNLIYIPNVIEISQYIFKERKNVSPNLLWVRSFAKIYNPLMAIEVFDQIKKKYPKATLCMVGPDKDGSLLQSKQKAQELNLDVIFTGKLSKQQWITKSEEYCIFINTTHFDNMPVSVIEAMALGLAVISTNVGGIPFLVEDRREALLVRDNNVDEMVQAVTQIIEQPHLFIELTSNAREKAILFDWEFVKYKWISILT